MNKEIKTFNGKRLTLECRKIIEDNIIKDYENLKHQKIKVSQQLAKK